MNFSLVLFLHTVGRKEEGDGEREEEKEVVSGNFPLSFFPRHLKDKLCLKEEFY